MASTTLFLRPGTGTDHPVYVRYKDNPFSIDTKQKTGKTATTETWKLIQQSKSKGTRAKSKLSAKERDLRKSLDNLEGYIHEQTEKAMDAGIHRDGRWLKEIIGAFNQKKTKEQLDIELMTYQIDRYIEDNDLKKGRVTILLNLKAKLTQFDKDVRVGAIGSKFKKDFSKWMIGEGYSESTVHKCYSDVRTIVRASELPRHPSFDTKAASPGKKPKKKYIHVLSLDELAQIKATPMPSEHLENVKRWLLLGCFVGQRKSDFLRITEDYFTTTSKGVEVIELCQQKTGKDIVIPVLDEVREIRENGLPYRIEKFNKYVKEVCRLAGINEVVKGQLQDAEGFNHERTLPKWRFIASHVCRRSFATNFHGKIPTPLLMSITGHATEATFLDYIGKTNEEKAEEAMNAFAQAGLGSLETQPILKAI